MKNTLNKDMMKMIINGTAYALERRLKALEDTYSDDDDMYPLELYDLTSWLDDDLGEYLKAKGAIYSMDEMPTSIHAVEWLKKNTEGVFESLDYAEALYRSFWGKSLMKTHKNFKIMSLTVCQQIVYFTAMYIVALATQSNEVGSKEEALEIISIVADTSPSANIDVR